MKGTGWLTGLQVTAEKTGIVSHAGVALIRALATDRLLVHDRGRVLADLACAIADGAGVISDFRVIGGRGDQGAHLARFIRDVSSGGWPDPGT